MLIAVKQTIGAASGQEGAPEGYRYDDPWAVAQEIAGGLRNQYLAWLNSTFPEAMIEVDRVKEGNAAQTTGVKVVVFRFGRIDNELKEMIEPFLSGMYSGFDMAGIDRGHLQAMAG